MPHPYSIRGSKVAKRVSGFSGILYLKGCSHMAEALLGPGFLT